ncbi:carbohydrate ABC transporter permease [Alkalibacterium olivapovliticus]|uniref:Multiple sugar transport system permease protein n=1 Tax=Alkalibacterium olivapovliticus TaxID=99907 RepID=A0A2T0W706_9LACT|nr:sugar ABC transporter permease [Alkalibacterium olivapovliticus]PRY82485.1 multiple sugar transport system permease protein [Alkalibacterium olivapovliticus]
MKISKTVSSLMFLPFLLFFILFWMIPFLYGLYVSFHSWTVSGGNGGFVGLDNYIRILSPGNMYHDSFMNALGNTLYFVVISLVPLVVFALLLALLIENIPGKLKVFFRTVFFISYAVSVTAVSAIFKWLFTGNGGYINNVLQGFGLDSIGWLNNQPYAWIAVLAATVWWTIGYNMILFVNALDEVDDSLYEAASLDGANAWQRFWNVTFPSIKGVFVFVTIITVIASFNLYGQTLLITEGGPARSTMSLTMIIQNTIFSQNNLGMGSAMAILMGIIMVFITLVQFLIGFRKDDNA